MTVARKIPQQARPNPDPHAHYPAPGPATRVLAKATDFFCYPFLAGVVLAILALLTRNPAVTALAKHPVFPIAMWVGFPFIDALFHYSLGNTPGKWLLGFTTVPKHDGSFFNYLGRSSKAFVYGLAGMLPFALITLALAWHHYQKWGETSWDRSCGFRSYAYRSPWLGGIVVLGFLGMVVLTILQRTTASP